MTAKIWAISTNKGGCLKTSITTCLAGVIANQGKKVLIVDTDNQGDCLLSFGQNPDQATNTIYQAMVAGMPAQQTIHSVHKRIDVIPANDDMTFFELDVLSNPTKYPKPFGLLKTALAPLANKYDYILVDTPPNLGLTQGNVLSYVQGVLIPFQPEHYSLRSLVKILAAIADFKAQHNPKLSILGVVPTLVDLRTTLHTQLLQECRRYCEEHHIHMTDTVIPRSVRFASSIAYDKMPATLTRDNRSPVVAQYEQLFQEVLTHDKP